MRKRGKKFWLGSGFLALIILLFFLNILISAQTTETPQLTSTNNFDLGGWMIKMGLFLGLIIGLIYVSLYLLKRYVYRPISNNSGGVFQILESTSIAPKKSLLLVKVLDRLLVLGVSESQINALAEIEEASVRELVSKLKTNATHSGDNFQTYLGNFLKRAKRQS